MSRSSLGGLIAVLLLLLTPSLVAARGGGGDDRACSPRRSGEQCGPGGGRQTIGGGEKVSHKGWPAITGILWKVLDGGGDQKVAGPDTAELLAHHGSARLAGMGGHDVLWGDWDPRGNSTSQHDTLRGGDG